MAVELGGFFQLLVASRRLMVRTQSWESHCISKWLIKPSLFGDVTPRQIVMKYNSAAANFSVLHAFPVLSCQISSQFTIPQSSKFDTLVFNSRHSFIQYVNCYNPVHSSPDSPHHQHYLLILTLCAYLPFFTQTLIVEP